MKKNVLVFPCGSEIGLEVNRSLAHSRYFTMYGASSVEDHGRYAYKNYLPGLPRVDEPDFCGAICRAIRQYAIDFVVPANDRVLIALAEMQESIPAPVVTSPVETCRICNSKAATYRMFGELLPTPAVYDLDEPIEYPVFLKPDVGNGSKGTRRAASRVEVELYRKLDPTLLALEYLPGKEYTVDCFTDRNRQLRFCAGRERVRISNGISVHSRHVDDARFRQIAETINGALVFRGVWFFQVKERADGELVLMEIAPRVAGTMGLVRAEGVNLLQMSLLDRMDMEVTFMRNEARKAEVDRALCAAYSPGFEYECVYIDLEHTIISEGEVNPEAMRFLYQARAQRKRIVLLTRREHELHALLGRHAISSALFNEIRVVHADENKSDHIIHPGAILVDDSYAERSEVVRALHIPVFALDALEALVEHRA